MRKKIWIGLVVVLLIAITLFITKNDTQNEDVIKIGAILPLTGDAAQYGKAAQKGIELAIEEINEQGKTNKKKFEIIFEDTQGNPKTGVTAIQKLILKDKITAAIGGLFSSVTLAVAPVMNQNKIVLLSPASSAPKITQAGDYIFRNCPSDVYEGGIMADYAFDQLDIRKAAILYVNNDYGVGIKTIFAKQFIAKSGQIIAEESFEQNATDFRTQLIKIKNAHPEAIYLIGHKEMGLALKQAKELGIQYQFLSTVMFEDPKILEIAGSAAEGVIYSASSFDTKSDDPTIKKFVSSFEDKYGQKPDVFSALSYDAMKIMELAFKSANSTDSEIKESIYQIKNYSGVMGTISFDLNGDVVMSPVIKEVKDGTFTFLNR